MRQFSNGKKMIKSKKSFLSLYQIICPIVLWRKKESKRFFEIAKEIVNRKISIEYIINYSSKIEALRTLLCEKFEKINFENLNIEGHIKEGLNNYVNN